VDGKRRKPPVEHARIELIGLAVHIDETARKMRAHDRIAAFHDPEDQFVDEGILRSAQRREIQPRRGEKVPRIDPSAMWRVEQHRAAQSLRLEDLESGIQLVVKFRHADCRPSAKSVLIALVLYPLPASIVHSGAAIQEFGTFTRYLPGSGLWRAWGFSGPFKTSLERAVSRRFTAPAAIL
jgi:hypothetical protein